jgi:hypothetical protein
MRDAMTVITAIVLTICGLTYCAESRADYVLQFVLSTGDVVTAKRYRGSDTKAAQQCLAALYRAKVEERVTRDRDLYVQSGGCVPCDEFPSQCQEGI